MVSQMRLAGRDSSATPLPYTASPVRLLLSDLCLVLRYAWALPAIFLPIDLGRTRPLDELYPSPQSIISIVAQVVLTVYQLLFLLSVPLGIALMVPALWMLVYIAANVLLNFIVCLVILNGPQRILVSQVPVSDNPEHHRERWYFINGVAGGHYWVQNNIDQLSYTFGRRVTGVHNRTAGLVFDLLECLIQRAFAYATTDVRSAYVLVKKALLNSECDKIVLILHSQGGIEGSLIVDWLLDELPHELLHRLEIYTFGNAANHFNNPGCSCQPKQDGAGPHRPSQPAHLSVGHIEHYANSGDPITWLGVQRFANIPNRFMGRLFVRPGSGHMLNQHYLDNMFTLGAHHKVLESNAFMDMEVEPKTDVLADRTNGNWVRVNEHREETLQPIPGLKSHLLPNDEESPSHQIRRVKDYSRLWQYRNGGSPAKQKSP